MYLFSPRGGGPEVIQPQDLNLYAGIQKGGLPAGRLIPLLASVIVFLSAWTAWFSAWIRGQRKTGVYLRRTAAARWLAAGTIALSFCWILNGLGLLIWP